MELWEYEYLTEWSCFDPLSAFMLSESVSDEEYAELYNHFVDWSADDLEKIDGKKDLYCRHNYFIIFLMAIETDETISFFCKHKDEFSFSDYEDDW